jgi:hypothetical protein
MSERNRLLAASDRQHDRRLSSRGEPSPLPHFTLLDDHPHTICAGVHKPMIPSQTAARQRARRQFWDAQDRAE